MKRDYVQIIFVILAFALMVAIGGFFVSNTLQRTSLFAMTVALDETEKTIRAYLREPKIAYDNIYAAIQDILERDEPQEVARHYLTQTTELLREQEGGVEGFITVYGFIREELLLGLDWDYHDDYIPQQRPWYQLAIRSSEVVYTAPYIDEFTGIPIISLTREIYGGDGEYYGVLALDVDISWLMGYAESLHFVEGGYGMILSQYLYTIAHPQEQYVDVRLQDLGGSYAVIADMLRTNREVSAMRIRDIDGSNAIVFFKQLYNGWYIGVVLPTGSYYADLYLNIITLAVLGVILAFILSLILLRLSVAKNRSEEENKAKSSFLAMMSHEMRTPMNAIIGIAQIQMQKKGLPGDYAEALAKIYSSGSSLLGIINDLLDMSKIETGKLELNLTEYNTPSLINDIVQLNMVRIGSKPIRFLLEVDESLPSLLYGDELRIKQILNNLLSNAIKFTDEGRVKLSVGHSIDNEDVILRISVEDTGQGIKPEDIDRLFVEYLRFNTGANRRTEGTGLGLSITKRLVEMMDGTIKVESEYGKGSLFSLTVKQKAVKCDAIGPDTAKKLCSSNYTGGKQAERQRLNYEPMPYGSVLVVDDVDINLFVAEGIMEPYQLQVELVESGISAIGKVESGKKYDVIFMDHMMPGMDGIEATHKLRAMGYSGAIVALTANALVGNEEMFEQNGFDGFLSKPIDILSMDAVLNRFIRDRHKTAGH